MSYRWAVNLFFFRNDFPIYTTLDECKYGGFSSLLLRIPSLAIETTEKVNFAGVVY